MKEHQLIAAAALFAVLLYTGVLPKKQTAPASLLAPAGVKAITGRVSSNPNKTGPYYFFTVDVESVRGEGAGHVVESDARGKAAVLYPAALMEALFPGKLYSGAKGAEVPFVDSGIRLTFEGKTSGAFFVAKSARAAPPAGGAKLRDSVARFRSLSRLAFRRILYAWGKAGGLFLALVTGSREYTEESLAETFTRAGLAHVLALSGMHLSIFTGFSGAIGKRVGKRFSTALSYIMVILFVWFAGFTPSLRRAFLCFLLHFFCALAGKRAGMTAILALSFVIHTIIAPEDWGSISFILSYLGLAGLLVAGKAVEALLCRIPRFPFAQSLSASCGAFIATSPVTRAVFGRIAPIGIVSSLAVSPIVTVFVVSGILCFVAMLAFPALTFPLGALMNAVYRVLIWTVKFFSRL